MENVFASIHTEGEMKSLPNIPKTMKALVAHGGYDYRYEDIPVPQINEDEILVKVEDCGICAGDIKAYHGAEVYWGSPTVKPFMDGPVVAGHEFTGIVVAIGDNAAKKWNLKIGDRAVAEQIVPCGECKFCKEGHWWMCQYQHIHGHQKIVADGGMAEYMKYTVQDIVHKVSKDVPAKYAALIEPLSCAVHTIERAAIKFNDIVVVAGMGPIGLCDLQLAKLKNPKLLIAVDTKEKRLQAARELGADVVLNPAKCDAAEEVRKLSDGYGCDVYINVTGHPSGCVQGLDMIRKLGTFVEFGVFGADTTVNWSVIGDRKELDIRGSHIGGQHGYDVAISMLEKGIFKAEKIVTHEFPLSRWKEAFDMATEGEESIKIVLNPEG